VAEDGIAASGSQRLLNGRAEKIEPGGVGAIAGGGDGVLPNEVTEIVLVGRVGDKCGISMRKGARRPAAAGKQKAVATRVRQEQTMLRIGAQ